MYGNISITPPPTPPRNGEGSHIGRFCFSPPSLSGKGVGGLGCLIILLALICGCAGSSHTKPEPAEIDAMAEPYKKNIVQITAEFSNSESKYGFGFVVGEESDNLYIITAKHVVQSDIPDIKPKDIQVQFYENQGKTYPSAGIPYLSESAYDLALLEVKKPFESYRWEKRCYDVKAKRGDYVWFIGQNKEWDVSLDAGIIKDKASPTNFFKYKADMHSVQVGTSGAPLFTRNGIVGVIIEDSLNNVFALGIEFVKEAVKNLNKRWDLDEQCQQGDIFARITKRRETKEQIRKFSEKADFYFHTGQYISPKDENAYDYYKKVLNADIADRHAQSRILDILKNILSSLDKKVREVYVPLIIAEKQGRNVKDDMVKIVDQMLADLTDSKKICEEYPKPQKDAETDLMCKKLDERIRKYELIRVEYQLKNTGASGG